MKYIKYLQISQQL